MKLEIETSRHVLQLHQEWMSGQNGKYKYRMTSGAGCGGAYLGLEAHNTETGEYFKESIDMRILFEEWLVKIIQNDGEKVQV